MKNHFGNLKYIIFKDAFGVDFALVLGGSWEGLGRVWGGSWAGLAALGPFLDGVSVALFRVGVRNRLQEGSWSRFRSPRAWFWEGPGRVLGRFCMIL